MYILYIFILPQFDAFIHLFLFLSVILPFLFIILLVVFTVVVYFVSLFCVPIIIFMCKRSFASFVNISSFCVCLCMCVGMCLRVYSFDSTHSGCCFYI